MKKINILWVILGLIFLVIFNSYFFVLGGNVHKTSVWISYFFIHLSYFMLIITTVLIRNRKRKSATIYGISLYAISSVYFVIELIAGIAFILVAPSSYKVTLLLQLLLAAIYSIVLISNMLANEHSTDAEKERHYQIEYVKDASAEIKMLLARVVDKTVQKKIERIHDSINSSPVKSHPNLSQLEARILQSIYDLDEAIATGTNESIVSLADSLLAAVNDRNTQLKKLNSASAMS